MIVALLLAASGFAYSVYYVIDPAAALEFWTHRFQRMPVVVNTQTESFVRSGRLWGLYGAFCSGFLLVGLIVSLFHR